MRLLVAAAVLLTAGLVQSPAEAKSGGCRAVTYMDEFRRPYQVEVCEGTGGSARRASSSSSRGRRYRPGELVRVVSSVDGVQCSIWATRTSVQGRRAATDEFEAGVVGDVFDTSVWEVWQDMVAALPACGAGGGNPSEQTAFDFLYTYVTPDPEPWIAPGWGITGKASYLETRGPATHAPEPVDTPLGTLEVVFEATTFTVDWGDGTGVDEFSSPGEPWPDGAASHVYVDTGVYDVVVAQRWQATWKLGERSGQVILTGAPSVIGEFPVDQLQAVRDR